jgi:hypothetical protein
MGLAREYGGGAWRFDNYPSIVINSSAGSECSVDMEHREMEDRAMEDRDV